MHGLDAEVKVKLPCRHVLRVISVFVRECESDLDDLEQVNVAPHGLIVVIRGCLEGADWSRDNTRELGVLIRGMTTMRGRGMTRS